MQAPGQAVSPVSLIGTPSVLQNAEVQERRHERGTIPGGNVSGGNVSGGKKPNTGRNACATFLESACATVDPVSLLAPR